MGNATSVGKCIKNIIVCFPQEDNVQAPEMVVKASEDLFINAGLNTATQENRNQFTQFFKERKIPQEIQEVLNRQWEESKELKEIGEFAYSSPLKAKQIKVDQLLSIEKDNTVYNGQIQDGKKHGYGVQKWSDGAMYEGM